MLDNVMDDVDDVLYADSQVSPTWAPNTESAASTPSAVSSTADDDDTETSSSDSDESQADCKRCGTAYNLREAGYRLFCMDCQVNNATARP